MLKKTFLLLGALLVFLGLGLLFVDFEAPEIGLAAAREASAATGIAFEASRFRFNLLRGLTLERVEASGAVPTMGFELSAAEVRFAHRPLALLRGRLEIRRVIVEAPRIELVYGRSLENVPASPRRPSRGRTGAAKVRTEAPARPLDLEPDVIELRDAVLVVRDARDGDGGVRVSHLDLLLREPRLARGALTLLHGLSSRGRLSAEAVRMGSLAGEDIEADFSTERGQVELAGRVATSRALLSGDLHLDLKTLPVRHRMRIQVRLRDRPITIDIDARGFGLDPSKIEGDGSIDVAEGAAFWGELAASKPMRVGLHIGDGRARLEGDELEGVVELDGHVEIVLEGRRMTGTWDGPDLNP